MFCLHTYCSSTKLVLETVSKFSKTSHISIKPEDSTLEKKIKGFGIYAERGFFKIAFAVAFLAIPILVTVELCADCFIKVKFKATKKFENLRKGKTEFPIISF
ncbi:MAG: hypothetical protein H0V82_07595 [Candidatus Protochlamydia sp.]|nr:hypothetical protein [Candidatus Protochlamydia sp.]